MLMMNFIKQHKVLVIIVGSIILLIIAGVLSYFLYFKDYLIKYEADNQDKAVVFETSNEGVERIKSLVPYTAFFGTIKEKNGNQIKIEAQINDPSKPEGDGIEIIDYTISSADSIIISESIKTGDNLYKTQNSEGTIDDIVVGSSVLIKSLEKGKIIYITK